MNVITYINFKNLDGKELDEDFRKFCLEKGMTNETKFSIAEVPSITGHQSFIVIFEQPSQQERKIK
jgi:hypothetical protein